MIHIKITKNKNFIKKAELLGHANFADYGKDIVCAGVSSILTTTINGILRIKKDALTYENKKDAFYLIVNSEDKITQILLENMFSLWKELEQNYPKNIKVEEEKQ